MATIDRILQLVRESGLTAKDFAIGAGIAGGSITDWKTGRSKPSVESLQKIAKYANVQLEWLTGDTKFRTIEEDFENFTITQIKILILKTIERYHSEYVIPCSLKEKDINFLTNLLSNVNLENIKDTKKKLASYTNSFEPEKRDKIEELIQIIVSEMINDLESKNKLLYYNSLIMKESTKQAKKYIKFSKVPIVGKIAAGQPILAQENIEGYLPVDPNVYGMSTSEDLFYLRVSGESMNKIVKNGDYALIHKQDYADNGDIIVAIVNGDDEATLKRYRRINEELIILEPMSSLPMEPLVINLKETPFKIIGKAIGQFGKF